MSDFGKKLQTALEEVKRLKAENARLKEEVKELYKILDDDDDSGMLGISGV